MSNQILLRRSAAALSILCAPLGAAVAQQTPARLDTVVVVAARTRGGDETRSVDVITRDQIARSSARTIADVLAQATSVDVYGRSPAQADVSIRGSSPEQTVILVDGVRMTDIQSAHYALDLAVPLQSVERIEILRGAGSALYGPDAIGGVINIVTRRTAGASLEARTGSFGTVGGSGVTGARVGAASIVASADYEKSDGHRPGTDYRDGQGRVSVLTPVGDGSLQTNLATGIRDFGAADFYAPYNSIERTTTTTLDSRWESDLGPFALSVDGNTRRHQDHYVLVRDEPALYENRHESWQTGGEVVARATAGPARLAFGAEGVHDQLSSARLGGRREWRAGAFVETSAGAPDAITGTVGLRGDRSSAYGSFFSPSAGASARVTDWLRLRTSGAIGFRAPTWTERYYTDPSNIGNPNLRPERFWTGEAGARATGGDMSLDVAAFTRHATDLIDWVKPVGAPATAVWQTENVGEATFRGIEGTISLPSVGSVTPSVFGTGIDLDASEGAQLTGKYALRPIVRQAGLRLGLAGRHPIDARIDLMQERRAHEDAYLTGTAHVAWTHASYRVTFDVANVTNADWLDASGKSAAARAFIVGFGWMP